MSKLIIESVGSTESTTVDLTKPGAPASIDSAMRRIVDRNLLKYAAGRAMFCSCGQVADYRRWVIVERPDGTMAGNCCASCHDAAMGDKPLPAGYRVIREGKPAKKAAKPKAGDIPQKPGKALNTWLRKTIDRAHRIEDRKFKVCGDTRLFPKNFGTAPWPMLETVADDGTVTIEYQGDPHYSAQQVADYVQQFCRLNHLTGA